MPDNASNSSNSTFLHPELGPLRLGRSRVSPRDDKSRARTLRLNHSLITLPDPPTSLDLTGGRTDWGMMLNNTLGDCTCAAAGHEIQVWSGQTVTDSDIELAYEGACGYKPGDPSTDNGGYVTQVMEYMRVTGIGGHKVVSHAEVNVTELRVRQAMWLFGGIEVGVGLPVTAQAQVGQLWDVVDYAQAPDGTPWSWGGHAIALVKYDTWSVWGVTWGQLQEMTWRWLMYYCDEAQAAISGEWSGDTGTGTVDRLALAQDLTLIGH
jgi:hypothetical protein